MRFEASIAYPQKERLTVLFSRKVPSSLRSQCLEYVRPEMSSFRLCPNYEIQILGWNAFSAPVGDRFEVMLSGKPCPLRTSFSRGAP